MATPQENKAPRSFGERLMSVNRTTLYGLLIAVTSIPLFFDITLPNQPTPAAIDAFATLSTLPEGSTVLIQSDWTISTRGESAGNMEAALRILMRRGVNFAIFSVADPQAPQVARDVVARINAERRAAGQPEHERWNQWVNLGLFPNAEATLNSFGVNFAAAIRDKTDVAPISGPDGELTFEARPVLQSPVFRNVRSISDASAYIVITASGSINVAIERLADKVPMVGMVTGVMGPETLPYYTSGQLRGLSAGLKGVYDMEWLMEFGLNSPPDRPRVVSEKHRSLGEIRGFEGEINLAKGKRYYPTLHAALFLMILAVVVGNIGMFLTRKRGR